MSEALRLKEELERAITATDKAQESRIVLDLLDGLKALGPLPQSVLRASLVGRTVNSLTKSATLDPSVRSRAQELVESWKSGCLKRKADVLDSGSREATPEKAARPAPEVVEAAGRPGAAVELPRNPRRAAVARKLQEALEAQAATISCGLDMRDSVRKLAVEVENALDEQLSGQGYASQARSVLYNLKDPNNRAFATRLLTGALQPSAVPQLDAEAMASDVKATERAQVRQDAMEAVQADWDAKHISADIEGMIPCGKCRSTKTMYNQAQVGHGLDEPLTTYVTCFDCGNRWKFDDVGASADVDGS